MFSCIWTHVCTNMWRAKVDESGSLIKPEAGLFQLVWPASLPAIHKVCILRSQHISLDSYGSWRIYSIPHPCMSSTLSTEPSPRGFSLLCYCICIYVFTCMYVFVTCAHSDCGGQKRTCDSPGIRVTGGCEPWYGFWELDPVKQPELLTTEQFFITPQAWFFKL